MSHTVRLTADAEQDLVDIHFYVASHDGASQADAILDRLETTIRSLASLPNRGNVPPELERVGFGACRELHEPPYRIIYQVSGNEVRVLFILDARRNVRDILEKRLLR